MRVFVTGANGFVGRAVVQELQEQGHKVSGLARTAKSAATLRAMGVEPIAGGLEDRAVLAEAAARADGVIHLAFMHNPFKASFPGVLRILLGGAPSGIIGRFMAVSVEAERAALQAMGGALKGSGRPFVTTFATLGLAESRHQSAAATEADGPNPRSPGFLRARLEEAVEALASTGVRAAMVRLAPSVHGPGDGGLVPEIIRLSRKAKRSVYLGDGANRWPAVHVRDAARLFRLALENGVAASRYHAVGEEGLPFRRIAEALGEGLGVPVGSQAAGSAAKHFGWLAPFVSCDNPCSSGMTQQALGWRPSEPGLIADLGAAGYFG